MTVMGRPRRTSAWITNPHILKGRGGGDRVYDSRMRYFPGLNTLRLFAALSVVIVHASEDHRTPILGPLLQAVTLSGRDAVTLFFVLSGFLITYGLLDERQRTGRVGVGRFYWKRALRIWPLYLLVGGLSFALAPGDMPRGLDMTAWLLFSAHLAHAFGSLGYVSHFWSIGVEEWFYAVWPVALNARRVLVMLTITLLARPLLLALLAPAWLIQAEYAGWGLLAHELRPDCMAVGALAAYTLHTRHGLLRRLYRCEGAALGLFAAIIVLGDGATGGALYDVATSAVFAVVILNVASNPERRLSLETAWSKRWGAMTYGIYLWHRLVLAAVGGVYALAGGGGDVWREVAYYALAVGLTLSIAALSYRYFEQYFLRLKDHRFAGARHQETVSRRRLS